MALLSLDKDRVEPMYSLSWTGKSSHALTDMGIVYAFISASEQREQSD